jgi:hypothetical protein
MPGDYCPAGTYTIQPPFAETILGVQQEILSKVRRVVALLRRPPFSPYGRVALSFAIIIRISMLPDENFWDDLLNLL